MLNHATGVGLQAGHGAANVSVYFYNLFDRGGFEEGGGYALFDTEKDAVRRCYLDHKGDVSFGGSTVSKGKGEGDVRLSLLSRA